MPSTPEKKAAHNAANKDKHAAQRLVKKLRAAYDRNEDERTNRDRLTPFDGGAKASTLNKYGIRVHWDKENFKVQTRAPEYPVEDPGNVDPRKPETRTGGMRDVWERIKAAFLENPDHFKQQSSTIDQHMEFFWRVFKKTEYANDIASMVRCINDGAFLQKVVNGVHFKTGEDHLLNTKKSYCTALNFMVNTCEVFSNDGLDPKAAMSIELQLVEYIALSRQGQIESVLDGSKAIDPFSEIFERGIANVSKYHETAVWLHLARDLTLRGDYEDVHVYDTRPDPEPAHNYYVRDKGVIYWKHIRKTGHRYPIHAYQYSQETRDIIEGSLRQKPRDKLITSTGWYLLNKVGTSVNELRHAKISEMYLDNPRMSMAERRKKAEEMYHSFATQKVYVRELRGRFIQAEEQF
jgi:hypothetical protein